METNATLPEQLWFALRKAATMMERRAEAVVTRETGVSLGLYMVLSVLDARPEMGSQQAIADRLGLTKGTVSRLLEGARTAGLADTAPSPTSRRERIVTLTDAGRALVRAADAALLASDVGTYADREPDAARAVIAGLDGLIASLEGRGSAPLEG
ncbi:MarR family winged helix-turn-helix transcriptional regulator [Demequina iriomotensis]|uniref:MarR family winged helix-turn-helix transcriptional regulator n=1 Tax=Demequina iriomotensis TaxID=1536641 RepID=UPI000780AD06|nr:MarR family winged helix-turn-helix transcriptional regulator [Demequina iriomotensis]